mmetsp:Transcript_17602/g.25704  ORF Transcript_17602/g.25704 Transcript_17602/m.25704 type:complete len:189 (-) Transcript_17602:138-704(-)
MTQKRRLHEKQNHRVIITAGVYGFVGLLLTVSAYVIYLVWSYVPEKYLNTVGITYYPSKYWAIAVPIYVIVCAFTVGFVYMAMNFLSTAPPNSYCTITDSHARRLLQRRQQSTTRSGGPSPGGKLGDQHQSGASVSSSPVAAGCDALSTPLPTTMMMNGVAQFSDIDIGTVNRSLYYQKSFKTKLHTE